MTQTNGPKIVRVFDDAGACEAFVNETWFGKGKEPPVLGMDCEYNRERKISVVQLSDETTAVVVRLSTAGRIPRSVCSLLANVRIHKAGVGVHDDAEALRSQHGVHCNSLLDLAAVAIAFGVARGSRGLGELGRDILGFSKREAHGAASAADSRALYAAEDAWLGARIASVMHENLREGAGETISQWCARAEAESSPHVQTHADFGTQHESAEHKAAAGAPKRLRKELAERRWKRAEEGFHRKRLEELRKRKEHMTSGDAAVDEALKELVDSRPSEPGQPPGKKKKKPKSPKEESGGSDGIKLNLI